MTMTNTKFAALYFDEEYIHLRNKYEKLSLVVAEYVLNREQIPAGVEKTFDAALDNLRNWLDKHKLYMPLKKHDNCQDVKRRSSIAVIAA